MGKQTELARSTANRDQIHIPVAVKEKFPYKDGDLIIWLWDEDLKQVVLDLAVILKRSDQEKKETKTATVP